MSSTTTVSQIKTGLAANLATVSGLRAYAYQPDNVNTPFAWPLLESIPVQRGYGWGFDYPQVHGVCCCGSFG
jgi:hypothetical protein